MEEHKQEYQPGGVVVLVLNKIANKATITCEDMTAQGW